MQQASVTYWLVLRMFISHGSFQESGFLTARRKLFGIHSESDTKQSCACTWSLSLNVFKPHHIQYMFQNVTDDGVGDHRIHNRRLCHSLSVRRAENPITFIFRLSYNLVASTYCSLRGLSRPIKGLLYLWRHAVVQLVGALRYKPEGREFDSRWCHWHNLTKGSRKYTTVLTKLLARHRRNYVTLLTWVMCTGKTTDKICVH
jgi:hypothetical protein